MTIQEQIAQLKRQIAQLKRQIALLKRFATEDEATAKLLPPDNGMRKWFEGRSKGYGQAAKWLEYDVLPHQPPDITH